MLLTCLPTSRPPHAEPAIDQPRAPSRLETRFGLITLAVSVLAGLVSMINITRVSMWVDEAYTISVATRSLTDLGRMIANIDIVHSLYNLILHPWLAVFGISELSVRLPSVIMTAVATAGVMVLTRRLSTPPAALAAGLVFAVLPRVTWMGIEGRSYAMTAAVAVWLTVLSSACCGARPGASTSATPCWPRSAVPSTSSWCCCWAPTGSPCCWNGGSASAGCSGPGWARRWSAWPAGCRCCSPPSRSRRRSVSRSSGSIGLARNVLVNQWFLGGTPTIYLSGGGSLGDGPGSTLWKPAAVLLAAGCWLIIAFAIVRRTPDDPGTVPSYRTLLASWVVVPTAFLVGYSVVGTPLYNPRYLTYCAPAVAALLGIGLIKLRQLPGRLGWSAYVAAALIILLALPIFASQRTVYAKAGADWKPIAEFVEAHPGANQAAYFAPRVPPTGEVVTITSRTAKTLYPAVFDRAPGPDPGQQRRRGRQPARPLAAAGRVGGPAGRDRDRLRDQPAGLSGRPGRRGRGRADRGRLPAG